MGALYALRSSTSTSEVGETLRQIQGSKMMFKSLHLLALLGAQQSVAFQSTSYTARQTCASSKAFARPWWKPFAAGSDDITTSKVG